jgi:hypothetical protein
VPLRVNGATAVGEAGEEPHDTANKHEAVHRTVDRKGRSLMRRPSIEHAGDSP